MKSLVLYLVEKAIVLFNYLQNSKYSILGIVRFFKNSNPRQNVITKMYPREFKGDYLETFLDCNSVGVVFQGPYVNKNKFTFNSILLTRKTYPNIFIVLSTWKGSIPEIDKKQLIDLKCHIIENDNLPSENLGKYRKLGHLNSQLYSSLKGVEYLKSQNVLFSLKIRTDLRIHMRDYIPFFVNLLEVYKCNCNSLNKRLLNVSFSNNLVNCPFHMSDFIWFGNTEDMLKLYSITNRSINEEMRTLLNNKSYLCHQAELFKSLMNTNFIVNNYPIQKLNSVDLDFYYIYHEEAYIMHSFYESLNLQSRDNDLESYWDFVKNCIVIVDDSTLDVYWTKYGYSFAQNSKLTSKGLMNHAVWLDILLNFK